MSLVPDYCLKESLASLDLYFFPDFHRSSFVQSQAAVVSVEPGLGGVAVFRHLEHLSSSQLEPLAKLHQPGPSSRWVLPYPRVGIALYFAPLRHHR